ncbi:MAG: DUF998 domain-containing protein [Nitrososphaerota archaeon]|nr:DUF998 domain-containing protein [Nitrososphaerota archaeon]
MSTNKTKPTSDLKTAGSLFLIAGSLFYFLNMAAESIYPKYSDGVNALSDLGAYHAPTALLWDTMLFTFGVIFVASTYLYLRNTGNRLMLITFMLSGFGAVVVSLVPENSVATVHLIGAEVAFLFGGISAILTSRVTKPPFRYITLGLGIITLVADMLFIGKDFLGLGEGGMERMIVYPEIAFLIALGGYLLNS